MPSHGASPGHLAIGEVASAHGIRGLLRVRLYNPASELLASVATVHLERDDGPPEHHDVARATPHGRGLWLLQLDDVTSRTDAEALVGARIVVPEDALPALAEDEFYHHELLGFTVETTTGRTVGTIVDTLSTGLNDVWIVRHGQDEHLVPAIADVVERIDREAQRIVIVPREGLLD